ncbi:HPr family phosphocarrier protein [Elusimicrobiota bacterium]
MISKVFTVTNKLGLHARPASLFVQASVQYECRVQVSKIQNGEEVVVNGKSVMGLMMLAASCGEQIKVILDGEGEEAAMEKFGKLFEANFDEE